MGEFKEIDAQQAKELIATGAVTVIDVRQKDAYEEGHVEEAQHVDDANIETFIQEADKSRPLICYCYFGHSSKNAAAYFIDQGFKEVYSVTGGYNAWSQEA